MSKILRLSVENIKKISVAELELKPDGNLCVIVKGKNGQGKSSLLDSILYAIAGKRFIPNGVVSKGKKSAKIEIETDDGLKIVRMIKDNGSTEVVVTKDGLIVPKPQEFLFTLVHDQLSFDPLAFGRLSAKEQKVQLLQTLGIDTEKIDEDLRKAEEERLYVGRSLKQVEGEFSAIPEPDATVKDREEIDIAKLSNELRELENLVAQIATVHARVRELQEELAVTTDRLSALKTQYDVTQQERHKALTLELEKAGEINHAIRDYKHYKEAEARFEKTRTEYQKWTAEIDQLRTEKMRLLSAVKMPVSGMSIGDDGIEIDGVLFGNLSTSAQLRASMAVAMASNPKLRIVRILEGSLLDTESLKVVCEMAKEYDHQVWIEQVSESSDGDGIFVENGEVKQNV